MTTIVPFAVAKLPARSVAESVTVKVPPFAGVTHSSFGLPPPTVAPLVHTTRDPCRTVMRTVEIFESEICTPARVPPRSVLDRSATVGGVRRSALNRCAVTQ